MKRRYTNLLCYIAILLLVAACQPVQHQPQPEVSPDSLQAPVAGTWYNDDNLFGCMTLTVDDSSRFRFFEAGTTVNRYSSGVIHRDGAHIHFTSDMQYKTDAGAQSMHDTTSRVTVSGRLPRPGDTLNIYLNNEHYLLEKDTLYKLDNNGSKTDMKFHR